jgi:inosine kinase
MKFPGRRKSKHYFPVATTTPLEHDLHLKNAPVPTHIVGIDQVLVDIEAHIDHDFIERYGLKLGNSLLINEQTAEKLYAELQQKNLIHSEFAGGTIGNTLHNYSILADDRSVLFGVMSEDIKVGSYAYRYLCNTSSKVDLDHLQPVQGPIGRCFTLITECGERTFAISKGYMDRLSPESIDETIIESASALVLTAYLMRCDQGEQMTQSTMKAIYRAKKANVPVILTLGTRYLIEKDPKWWRHFIQEHVTVLAMNDEEAEALTGNRDPLLAIDAALELCDLVLCTSGQTGLYMGGYTEDEAKRETTHVLLPGEIPEFNRYEFSRPMIKKVCTNPIKVYSHIAPYMGGPEKIRNTNGAGDGALSALLHDMAANRYHKTNVQYSSKHHFEGLCYSSFSQVCKYANRVAYAVLEQHSPRLSRGLPEKEDSLEESYWDR